MKRKGFVMVWTLCALSATGILLSALFLVLHQALSWEAAWQRELDEVFIAQTAMEQAKYCIRFHKGTWPGVREERNGRTYDISVKSADIPVSDGTGEISMKEITCSVTCGGDDGVTLVTWVEEGP
ncbi:type II secretion system protein [Dialister sp.]|jgi:hypothetical protein|uniref:type II secretion system protein n=1 Tax=Dialister sp. TaxID=1955814 RepID=UPI003A5C52D3